MTNLVGAVPDTVGDVLTTTNNGNGLTTLLLPVQDGNGNNSAIYLSTLQFQFTGGFIVSRTAVTTTPYNVLLTDYIIAITENAAGVDIHLPAPAAGIYQVFIIKDEAASAEANPINISVTGGALINGEAVKTLDIDYQSLTVYSNGVNYFST